MTKNRISNTLYRIQQLIHRTAVFCILSSVFCLLSSIPVTYAAETVEDIHINYTGGKNNLERFLPKDFRNDTYNAEGNLTLPGTSIEIMSLENQKYILNVKRSIEVLEYVRSSIGFDKAAKDKSLLSIKLYDENIDAATINLGKDEYGNISSENPTIEEILKSSKYIDPVYNGASLTKDFLDDALIDLKEHTSEGAVDNFLYNFTKFNLLIIETMAIFFMVYGGLVWVTASGDDNQVETGKRIILWAVVGVVGGLVAYVVLNIIIQVFTS